MFSRLPDAPCCWSPLRPRSRGAVCPTLSTSLDCTFVTSAKRLPLWFRLLKAQRGKSFTGLTPSFLIGAALLPTSSKPDEATAYDQFVSLLSSFRDESPHGYHVVIAKCSIHGQPIVSLYNLREQKPTCEAIVNYRGRATSLYAGEQYFAAKKRTIDSLVEGLWRICKDPLVRGEYSFRGKSYCAFDDSERRWVARFRA